MIKLEFTTTEQRQLALDEAQANGWILTLEHGNEIDGFFEFLESAPIPTAEDIRAAGQTSLESLVSPYSPTERETWPAQRAEAEAYLADNLAEVPLLTAIATARGVTLLDLAGKVMANVASFQMAAGTILGEQQSKLDALEVE